MKRRWRPTDVPFIKLTASGFEALDAASFNYFLSLTTARRVRKCLNSCYDLRPRWKTWLSLDPRFCHKPSCATPAVQTQRLVQDSHEKS